MFTDAVRSGFRTASVKKEVIKMQGLAFWQDRKKDFRNRDPVKLTALQYLREAILKEEYETCGYFISVAKDFGATDYEVLNILEDPRRVV